MTHTTISLKVALLSLVLAGIAAFAVPASSFAAVTPKASFTTSSLTSPSTKPTLSGTASGTKSLRVVFRKEGSERIFVSKTVTVKKGVWKVKNTKVFAKGTYTVELFSTKKKKALASSTLLVGKAKKSAEVNSKDATTLAVASIPLLLGGSVKAGTTVPISYLQMENTGTATTSIKGFIIKQTGTAPSSLITGFTTVDDKGGSQATVAGTALFTENVAFIPTTAVFAPGQTRLFTIKATAGADVSLYLGTRLTLEVTSVETPATVKGLFPIRGTTWVVAP